MFCASVKNGIGSNGKGRNVVTPKLRWKRKKNTKVFQNLMKLGKLNSSGGQSSILRLSGGLRDCVLFLGALCDGIITKVDHETSDGAPVKRIPCPI